MKRIIVTFIFSFYLWSFPASAWPHFSPGEKILLAPSKSVEFDENGEYRASNLYSVTEVIKNDPSGKVEVKDYGLVYRELLSRMKNVDSDEGFEIGEEVLATRATVLTWIGPYKDRGVTTIRGFISTGKIFKKRWAILDDSKVISISKLRKKIFEFRGFKEGLKVRNKNGNVGVVLGIYAYTHRVFPSVIIHVEWATNFYGFHHPRELEK